MQLPTRDGLEWDDRPLGMEPRWARQPQLDAIAQVCRSVLALDPKDSCNITFHAQGAFNKVYIVETAQGRSVMRVSLPVDPGHKTRGEVTTLRWIRRTTNVPVPKVIAFDDTQNNAIGFEWILMELMPGMSAYKRWRKMSMADKTWVVEQIAEFQSQLFRHSLEEANFHSIGTLSSPDNISEPARANPKPGRIVALHFFEGDHFSYEIARGPFRSSYDWLNAYLSIVHQEQTEILKKEEDDDVLDDAKETLKLAARLTALLPKIFPSLQNPAEQTALWHDDLSLQNILVDDDGKVTGVIDWECVSCEPLWVVTEMPQFLSGRDREEEPDRDRYGDADGDSSADEEASSDDEELGNTLDNQLRNYKLDNEGKTDLYWINLMEYDQTQLREVYTTKMKELWPQWETEAKHGTLKLDFLGAVLHCASGWYLKRTQQWIDAVEAGEYPRLDDILSPNEEEFEGEA